MNPAWLQRGQPYGLKPFQPVTQQPLSPLPAAGGYPGPSPVNTGGAGPGGQIWPGMGIGGGGPSGTVGDDRSTGGLTGGPGQASPGWSTQDEVQNALYGPKPASDGGFLSNLGWKDAVGAAAGQLPMGGAAWGMAQLLGKEFANPGSVTARDKASAGFAIMGGPLAGASKLADWYAGTNYARNHPMESYLFGGNADQQGAKYADSAYRSGFGAGPMAGLYDAITAQKNLGGQGNVQKAIDDWRMSNYRPGQINIGEGILPNPYSINAEDRYGPLSIDNSGIGIGSGAGGWGGLDLSGGAVNEQSGSPVSVTTGVQPGGPDLGMGSQAVDSGGGGDYGGWSDAGAQAASDAMGDSGGYWSRGGRIPHPRPGMANPPGPDDQYGALQSGEGVLNRRAMSLLGNEAFMALNKGKKPKK